MRAAGLRSANEKNLPSFPARVPRIELDFVLVSKEIEVTNFESAGRALLRPSPDPLRLHRACRRMAKRPAA